jgi:GIY-YIG catalytic domain-containing protein
VDPARVVAELCGSPLYSIDEVRSTGIVPDDPGFYAWWTTRDVIPGVRGPRHRADPFELLYVGIAPSRPDSKAHLRSRLVRQHIGGNIASSTFRFGLAALLWEQQRWTPSQSASHRFRLPPDEERALSAWQRTYLRVRWCVVSEPWSRERDVVRELEPPMNREHNADQPFFAEMGDARTRFRDRARQA